MEAKVHAAFTAEIVDGGDQLSLRKVAGGAEYYQYTGFSFGERRSRDFGRDGSGFYGCGQDASCSANSLVTGDYHNAK
jgi:hypothetical protein